MFLGEIISNGQGQIFRVLPLIPFVSGAIPLSLHSDDGWESQFTNLSSNLSEDYSIKLKTLFKNIENNNLNTSVINTCYPSHKYKNCFYKTSLSASYWESTNRLSSTISSDMDNFLNLAYIINNTAGSPIDKNVSQFGQILFSNACPYRTKIGQAAIDKVIDVSNLTFLVGCTSNLGYQNTTIYNTSGNYMHLPQPHSEYWYARQGIHTVFQIGGIIQDDSNIKHIKKHIKIPAYLQNGYLSFSYNIVPPDSAKDKWFGMLMICDDYRIIKNKQIFSQLSNTGTKINRQETIISFLPPGETYLEKISSQSQEDPLQRNNPSNNVQKCVGDKNDIPIYGNYFLLGRGDITLPINKIAGKFIVFGVRGGYSDQYKNNNNTNNSYIPKEYFIRR